MKIASVSPAQNLNFKRRLTISEEKEMERINAQAKQILGNTGNSVLIVHDACLPQSDFRNTGVSNILNPEADAFFDFAKTYFGINTIEVLPQGEFLRKPKNGLICAYGYSALGLNDTLIDSEALTTNAWRNILLPKEFKQIVDSNDAVDRKSMVNFENINFENSVFDKNIRKAFGRFLTLNPKDELKVAFENFKSENESWLTPKVVYRALMKENGGRDWEQWNALDQQLYWNGSVFSAEVREQRIKTLLEQNQSDAEFYRFKQFLAETHLQEGRKALHEKGLKLFGDMPIKFSKDEMWANPEAFLFDHYVGANDWKAPCLNYQALRDENSPAAKLLKLKTGLFARRYDGTRIDVSWMYVSPKMVNAATRKIERLEMGDTALKLIEGEFQRVQGAKYSKQNIIHEFKAGREDFSMFKNGVLRPEIASRVAILESEYLSSTWGYADYFFKNLGISPDSGIYGLGDHTSQPLRQIAAGLTDTVAHSKGEGRLVRLNVQAPVLAKIFKDSVENMMKPAEFIRAKFADIMGAKHNFLFFMDALGSISRFDSQGLNSYENYRYKISANYKELYHRALQNGHALNLSDALARAFEKEGLAQSHPKLYQSLCKYAQILKEKESSQNPQSLENTSNKLGLKKWSLIAACGLIALGFGALALKNFAHPSNDNSY